jgi:hypothetical protein
MNLPRQCAWKAHAAGVTKERGEAPAMWRRPPATATPKLTDTAPMFDSATTKGPSGQSTLAQLRQKVAEFVSIAPGRLLIPPVTVEGNQCSQDIGIIREPVVRLLQYDDRLLRVTG